jgi:putative PIN family toxin of toxin-antitoxin system
MRIVADTNTVLSGLLWSGPPRRLLDLARDRALTLCTTRMLIAELAEVIGRIKFAQRVHAAGLSPSDLVRDFGRISEIVEPARLPAPVSRDPDDDQVIACAIAAHARVIVSGDHDLLDLGAFGDIRFLTTSSALALLDL